MPLEQGTRFGPYEIVAAIGAGGMGEVYKARDTRLDRTVALKILPSHIAAREDFRARFEREARAVSSLNHPHICTLYDVGKQDGVEFLVMEHLEGETLADRLERGPLAPDQAVHFAIQIADAVDRAHRKGIVHRDLKPGNIMLTRDGVKVLDFGLARTAPAAAAAAGVTMTKPLTTEGSVLGTPHYMSPEQIEGSDADCRTDIFAFGCVVYEMVAGRRAFDGKTTATVIGAVMTTQPPSMTVLQPLTPGALESIVTGCLVKDADLRYQSLWDVLIELRKVTAQTSNNTAVERKRTWLPWAVAAVLGVATVAVSTAAYFHREPLQAATVRFNIDPPDGFSGAFQLSPDGRYLAMVSQRKLWIRELGSLEAKAVDGVEDPSYPFWSPDSATIGFVAQQRLKRVAIAGGRIQTICDPGSDRTRGASWSKDGTIIFSAPGGIRSVSADGGTPVDVTRVPPGGTDVHRYPEFLPDGRHFLFLHQSGNADKGGIYVGSLDGVAPVRVLPDQENPSYAPASPPHKDGYLIFRRENALMAQQFDAEALRTQREAFPIADGVGLGTNARLGAFSVSANGVLAYRSGRGQQEEITWFDRTGKRLEVAVPQGDISTFAMAPNQKQLAVSRLGLEKGIRQHDIWTESEKGATSRFTYGPPPGWSYPVWSPDGKYLIYGTANEVGVANYEIHWKPATMVGQQELLMRSSSWTVPYDVSPDGKWLLYMSENAAWLLPLQGDRKPIRLAGAFDRPIDFMQFSPDGKFLSYAERNASGESDIYVQPFPATGAKWQLSLAGGNSPRWRKDGKELFFEAPDGRLMSVSVSGGAALQHGAPEPLFSMPPSTNDLYFHYQPSADGKRFMVISPAAGTMPSPITVALNWQSELKK